MCLIGNKRFMKLTQILKIQENKALFYHGGNPPVSWTLRRTLEVAKFHRLTIHRGDSTNIVCISDFDTVLK